MSAIKPAKTTARAPQRSNGIKRREDILNAAAKIISEFGVASLTLHATARRAKSSIGSMYHFFSDKDQLLGALRDRHRQDMAVILSGIASVEQETWRAMSTSEVIDTLFGRPFQYYSDNPFALELHESHEGQAIDEFMTLLETVLSFRLGEERGHAAAKMLFAISTGTLAFLLDVRDVRRRELITDVPAVLNAYLASQEARLPPRP